jgi:hypothetical protein
MEHGAPLACKWSTRGMSGRRRRSVLMKAAVEEQVDPDRAPADGFWLNTKSNVRHNAQR